jgi:hypothetical protein
VAICKYEKGLSPETDCAGTLISDFYSAESWDNRWLLLMTQSMIFCYGSLKLVILLSLPSELLGLQVWTTMANQLKCVCVCVCVCTHECTVGIEYRAWHILGKCFTTELHSSHKIVFFFLSGTGVWTRGFVFTEQLLYSLSHMAYFEDGASMNYLPRLAPNCNPPDFSLPSS